MFIKGKMQSSKCINNGFGKSKSFSFSTLHEDIHNFYTKLLMVAGKGSMNSLMPG